MKENNNYLINSRKISWIKSIYTLFVIAIPALLIWIFFSKDFFWHNSFLFWQKFLIALSFIVCSTLITILFIYFKILNINILSFSLPVAICFMVIFLTDDLLVSWARALIIVPFILLFIPINLICKKIETRIQLKNKLKWKIY